MPNIEQYYNQFLSNFPLWSHGFISIVLVILLAYAVFQTIKRNFIYLIVLVILLPASWPIIKQVWNQILQIFSFLLGR